jgi:hypothetical protein
MCITSLKHASLEVHDQDLFDGHYEERPERVYITFVSNGYIKLGSPIDIIVDDFDLEIRYPCGVLKRTQNEKDVESVKYVSKQRHPNVFHSS